MSGSASINAYIDDTNTQVARVLFEGSTALKRGMGLCYNQDYGTAATAEGSRNNRVELPSVTNARFFAGVVLHDHSAKAGGQWIEIAVPGSVCFVALDGPSVAVGAGLVTCQAGGAKAGYFTQAGFEGEGSAVPLQTVNASDAAALCLAKLQVGLPSGLVEVVAPAAKGATTFMVGGVTYLVGKNLVDGNVTAALAQASFDGLRKKYKVITTAFSNGAAVVTLATGGIQLDGSTALATITLDAVGEDIVLEFNGGIWVTRGLTGATQG